MKAWLPKISIRELLLIVAFVALAITSLRNASGMWLSILASLIVVVGGVMIVMACIERGARQAFAIGFATIMGVYLAAVHFTPAPRSAQAFVGTLHPTALNYNGALPTAALLGELWLRVRAPYYVTVGSNTPFERYAGPLKDVEAQSFGGGQLKPPKQAPPNGTGYWLQVHPKLSNFLAVGHLLFALALAYVGGKFAVWIYHRRLARETAETDSADAKLESQT